MTALATLQARTWAVVAAVADGRRDDVAVLLADLTRDDITMIVTVMADVMVDGHVGAAPERRALVGELTRRALLDLAEREGPADG
ncbi:hypothetical protein [Streptomyces coelicoflavus]|uniref:hypothetical protein n=1 Tax=Streptomyces coelicoflavus TaxID=285562 RepID=UPI00363D6518